MAAAFGDATVFESIAKAGGIVNQHAHVLSPCRSVSDWEERRWDVFQIQGESVSEKIQPLCFIGRSWASSTFANVYDSSIISRTASTGMEPSNVTVFQWRLFTYAPGRTT